MLMNASTNSLLIFSPFSKLDVHFSGITGDCKAVNQSNKASAIE